MDAELHCAHAPREQLTLEVCGGQSNTHTTDTPVSMSSLPNSELCFLVIPKNCSVIHGQKMSPLTTLLRLFVSGGA